MKWPNFFETDDNSLDKESNPSQLSLDIKLTQKAVSAILTIFMGFMGAGAYDMLISNNSPNSNINNDINVNPPNFDSFPEKYSLTNEYSIYLMESIKELKRLEELLEVHNCKFASTKDLSYEGSKNLNSESGIFYLIYLDLQRINKALTEQNCSILNVDSYQMNNVISSDYHKKNFYSFSHKDSNPKSQIFSTDTLDIESNLNFSLSSP